MECREILKELAILYVEDEEAIRELLQEVLEEDFKRFDVAEDGIEGLKKFREQRYDMVITDIEMPRLGGLDLAEEIRESSKEIPIILLTAYSEKERLFRAIDIGITKYLLKPFTPEKLLDVICQIAKERYGGTVQLGEGMTYNFRTKQIKKGEELEQLTKKEALLLELLLKRRGEIVTLDEIERTIWADGGYSENALRALVKRVRKKSAKELIKNFPALGYGLQKM
ncbi:MAG: DNA-binding response regulator [Epsilonproteobacteria bacterium]|nr:DNA-binding response regulator [Campylobacterota bacterium]NPA57216.1 DNA-binding response regulator [Campylobacterota bacterium]